MARVAREISVLGLYHVILRGVAQQVIFYEDQERIMFLKKLEHYSSEEFQVLASVNKIGSRHLEQLVLAELNEKNVFQLSKEDKIVIARKLISNYNLNKKQLSKFLAIPYKYLFKH